MNRYTLLIYWSDVDNSFVAKVPELLGCAADGKDYKEAVRNVELAIDEWIEAAKAIGREIPHQKIYMRGERYTRKRIEKNRKEYMATSGISNEEFKKNMNEARKYLKQGGQDIEER